MPFMRTAFIYLLCLCSAVPVVLGSTDEFSGSLITNFIIEIQKSPPEIAVFTGKKMMAVSDILDQKLFTAGEFVNGTCNELRILLETDIGSDTRPMLVIIDAIRTEELNCFLTEISALYGRHPSHVALIAFMILRPGFSEAEKLDTFDQLKQLVPNATLRSLLFVVFISARGSELWEFYGLRNVMKFQQINTNTPAARSLIERRRDFQGIVVKALAKEERDNVTRTVSIELEMLEALGRRLNFTLRVVNGNGWIWEEKNGTLVGMGQQLLNYEGDLVVASSELLPSRQEKLGISQPVIVLPLHGFYTKPHPSEYQNTLVEAFSPGLWLIFLVNGVLVYLTLLIFSCVSCRDEHLLSSEDLEVAAKEDAGMWTVAALCQQGWHATPTSSSLKIVVVVTLASSLLYYTAYSASIVSMYSIERNRFRNIDDLVSHGFTLYGNNNSLSGLGHVKAQALKAGVPAQARLLDFPDALEHLKTSRSALLTTSAMFAALIRNSKCTTEDVCPWISETLLPKNLHLMSMFYRKYDPMIKFIDVELSRWRESGLLFRDIKVYESLNGHRCDPPPKIPRKLGCADVRGSYYVLFIGFILSLVIFFGEISIDRLRRMETWYHDESHSFCFT